MDIFKKIDELEDKRFKEECQEIVSPSNEPFYTEEEDIESQQESYKTMKGNRTFKFKFKDGDVWDQIKLNDVITFVKPIDSTHIMVAYEKNGHGTAHHIAEFEKKSPDFYKELLKFVKGDEMIGGKLFENKVFESRQESKVISIHQDFKTSIYWDTFKMLIDMAKQDSWDPEKYELKIVERLYKEMKSGI